MTKLERFFCSLAFALLLAGVTLVFGQAKSAQDEMSATPTQQQTDCGVCHPKFQEAWASGFHGHATSDPKFEEAWAAQGKPGACLVCHVTGYDPATATWREDGVACEACHSPVPANHPQDPMPIDRTTDLCGHCHSDTRFGWQEWKLSAHYQRDMTCTVCHDPHSAAIKAILSDRGEPLDPSALCINCHREYSMGFSYSKHAQAGVKCVDCHLRHIEEGTNQDAHSMPDHSFNANLATCNNCHKDQMHSATAAASILPAEVNIGALPATETPAAPLTSQPAPVSPAGFAGLAGLLGLAGGMVLSPWLERLYRRMNTTGRKK